MGVSDVPVKEIASLEQETGILRLLTATDCIKDRLAAYYYWDDAQSLEQAVWVAEQNEFDIQSIAQWSKDENALDKFENFKKRVEK